MTIPTITSITPASGLTRGQNLITINGTGFRLPGPRVVIDGIVQPRNSISVQFDGVESDYAHAVTDIKAIARVPQYRGDYKLVPKTQIVRLANLDDDQVEIPTENVEYDGYTVERPKLTVSPIDLRVMEQFLRALRRHVHPNVWFTTDRLYWDLTEGIPDVIKQQATLPLIHINGINEEFNSNQQGMGGEDVETSPGTWETFRNGTAVDIVMSSIEIYSNASHNNEILNLGRAFVDFIAQCPFVRVTPETWDIGADDYEYPLNLPDDAFPSYDMGPALDGFKHCRTGAIIEGLELRDPNEQPYGWTRDWTSLELDFQPT